MRVRPVARLAVGLLLVGSSVFGWAVTSASAAPAPVALRLEPLGDSITYGSHSSTGNGYRGPLWNDLTAEGYRLDFVGPVHEGTMADSDNEGHPGWRIDPLQSIATGSVTTYKPNVVTLMAGANDLIQNHDVATAPDRLSALIDEITSSDPGVTVLVANLTVSTNANVVAYRAAYNAAIPGIVSSKQAAGQHVAEVDMSAVTLSDLVSDGIHPNDAGYQKMGDAWNAGVQAAATAGWITPPVNLGAATAGPSGEVAAGVAGKCLDVRGGANADGTAVQLYTCNHSPAQSWTIYNDSTLRSMGKCLDATAGATANGTTTQLYTCNGSANQQWAVAGLGPVVSGIAGKCLDDYTGANVNGTKADLWTCNGTAAQAWVVRYGTLQAGGLCLDVNGEGTADGTSVQLWDCNGTGGQTWQAGADGSLVNPQSGKCLDDPGFNATDGTQLDIWDCNGGANQQWTSAT